MSKWLKNFSEVDKHGTSGLCPLCGSGDTDYNFVQDPSVIEVWCNSCLAKEEIYYIGVPRPGRKVMSGQHYLDLHRKQPGKMKPHVAMQRTVYALYRSFALCVAKPYCVENNLSFDKLCGQQFNILGSVATFSQPSDVVSNGLLNDMDTMPFTTLIIETDGGIELVIKQTEYTKKYLSE